jgi:hypothetical protein
MIWRSVLRGRASFRGFEETAEKIMTDRRGVRTIIIARVGEGGQTYKPQGCDRGRFFLNTPLPEFADDHDTFD